MTSMSNTSLMLIFIAAAIVTWISGVALAKATDVLDDRFGLGEAIGGMILLSIAGSLPELAITLSAARSGHLDIAAGNLIGGVAMQTFVLVIADWFGRGKSPISTAAASLIPALEGLLVIAVVSVVAMGGLLPSSASIGPMAVSSIGILIILVAGMLILNSVRNRSELSFAKAGEAADASETSEESNGQGQSTRRTIILFVIASIATLFAGVTLEQSGNQLADNLGINGVLFG